MNVITWLLPLVVVAPRGSGAQDSSASPTHDSRGSARPTYRAQRASAPIRVDGRLDDAAWLSAATIDRLTQIEPENGTPSAFRTTFRILFDSKALYVGIVAYDSAGRGGVRVQDLRREFDPFENDFASIILDPLHDGRNSLGFQASPFGAQRELQVFDGDSFNAEWEGVWRTRTVITDSGWTGEIAIPWSTLRYRADGQAWNMNLTRQARRTNEFSAWALFPRNLNVYRMDFAGRLEGLDPPPPAVNVQVRPYGLATRTASGSSTARVTEIKPSIGGEIMWRPSTNLQVDGTLHTDFAQADVDRQVVNLSRFSVFFPERRQFFLENANVFNLGTDLRYVIRPFFSRSIGLDADGNPIPIQGGVRATWRDAKFNAGALLTRQDGRDSAGPTTFGVARASRNIGASGRLGMLVATRFDEGPGGLGVTPSTTVAVDGFARLKPTVNAEWMLSGSRNGATNEQGVGWYGFLGRQTDALYTGVYSAVATKGYNPTTGFVSRNDVIYTSPAIIGDWRPAWRPKSLRSFKPAVFFDMYHGPRDGALQEGLLFGYVEFVFNSGAVVYPYVERDFQRPTAPFEIVSNVFVPAGQQDYDRYGVNFRTDASANASAIVDLSNGGFFGGTLARADVSARWAPDPRAALALTYSQNRLRDVGDPKASVITHLLAPEVRLAWSPRVQLSGFYQYNSEIERGTANARFSWEFAPLSYLYVVYNDRRPTRLRDPQFDVARTNQLLVKLVYLWQP